MKHERLGRANSAPIVGAYIRTSTNFARWAFITLAVITLACYSSSAVSADTGYAAIQYLKIQPNGTYLKLQGFTNVDSSVSCERDDFFLLNTEENYKERTAFLLAAYMGDRNIMVTYYDCQGPYIRIGSVQARR